MNKQAESTLNSEQANHDARDYVLACGSQFPTKTIAFVTETTPLDLISKSILFSFCLTIEMSLTLLGSLGLQFNTQCRKKPTLTLLKTKWRASVYGLSLKTINIPLAADFVTRSLRTPNVIPPFFMKSCTGCFWKLPARKAIALIEHGILNKP